jgi:hypothetical protein
MRLLALGNAVLAVVPDLIEAKLGAGGAYSQEERGAGVEVGVDGRR